MDQSLFTDYALRYLLVPGQRVGAREAVTCAGISSALPPEIESLLAHSDALGHTYLVLTESDPLLMQWNPFSGSSPLYTNSPFGAALLGNHRWMQGMHESMVRALYEVIHESVHAVWAALGLRGLLTALPVHEQSRFHMFTEACAVLFGDLEAHAQLRDADLFESLWPAGATRSHAVAFSPVAGLTAAGVTPAERAAWIFSVYLDQERALPRSPEQPGRRAEALAFLIEESSYADKTELNTTPHWMRHYWGRAELEAYLRDFVPPAALELPGVPVAIDSVETCRMYWREIMLSGARARADELAYQRARLHAQRIGLRLAELTSALDSYRICAPEPERVEAARLIDATRDTLLSGLRTHLWSSQGALSEAESDEHCARFTAQLSGLEARLIDILGPCLVLEHPHLDGIPFQDEAPPLCERGRIEARERGELSAALKLVLAEAQAAHHNLTDAQTGVARAVTLDPYARRNAETHAEIHRLLGMLELTERESLRLEIEERLSQLQRERALWLTFPLEWTSACPFIDPLVGFRYR